MATLRHGPAPEDHYSLVSNDLARDPGISLQAKGLYLYLRSHREGWSMSTERIGEALGIHRNTVSKYVQELERAGFLLRENSHSRAGTFDGMEYTILSSPLHKNTDSGVLPRAVFTGRGKNVQHKKTNSFKKTNESKNTKSARERATACVIDKDWKPDDLQAKKLRDKHPDKSIDEELAKFIDWHQAKGVKRKDWYRAFDNWLKKARSSRQQFFEVDDPDPYGLRDAPF